MTTQMYSISLGSVDLDRLVTEDDFRRQARHLLPGALNAIGEKSGEVAWNEVQKGFRGIPGFQPNSSSSDKARFIRQAGENYRRKVSAHDRQMLEDEIIRQLREMKMQADRP